MSTSKTLAVAPSSPAESPAGAETISGVPPRRPRFGDALVFYRRNAGAPGGIEPIAANLFAIHERPNETPNFACDLNVFYEGYMIGFTSVPYSATPRANYWAFARPGRPIVNGRPVG